MISGQNGKPRRAEAGKAIACHRCKAPFLKGQSHIIIPQRKTAYTSDYRVCDSCYAEVLDQTAKDLELLRAL